LPGNMKYEVAGVSYEGEGLAGCAGLHLDDEGGVETGQAALGNG
jgi:hypothetical protein